MGHRTDVDGQTKQTRPLEAWDGSDWDHLSGLLVASGTRLVLRAGLDRGLGVDAAQQTIVRLLEARRAGAPIRDPVAWAYTVLSNSVRDLGRLERRRALRQRGLAALATRASPLPGPEAVAIDRELLAAVEGFPARLPAPYQQVARAHLLGWSHREASAYLFHWRPVSSERRRTILRDSHAMLCELGRGGDPRQRWPGRYKNKSGWKSTVPPPLKRLLL